MSNRAWMPLSIDDYMADTGHLTAAEHGAYMLLIMRYWKDGGLPDDERLIQRYARLDAQQWADSRDVIAAFFDAGWRHKRIDAELAKADEIIEKRRNAANGRHSKIKHGASAVQVQSTSTDTGVPPLTDNQDIPPLAPQGAGAGDIFDQVEKVFPRSPNYKPDSARRWFAKQSEAIQRDILSAARKYAAWFAAEQIRRNRPLSEALGFVPPLHSWMSAGTWKSAEALADSPVIQVGELVVLARDDPRIPRLEAKRGKPFVFGDRGTVTVRKSEVDDAQDGNMGEKVA